MKRSLLLFWFLTLALMLSGQNFIRTYGGPQDEHALSTVQTRSGDYLLAGFTYSYGMGKSDIWVMRLDRYGDEKWRFYFGEEDFEWVNDMIETRDGNIVVVGRRTENPERRTRNAWVFKLDKRGKMLWSKTFGGEHSDEAKAVVETADGGLAVAGFSESFSRGESDLWLLRLDADGEELWSKNYGGRGTEVLNDLKVAADGGFILGGYTQSYGNGGADILVMKVDERGKEVWRRNYGGARNEAAERLALTLGGEIVVAGWTGSEGSGSLDGTLLMLDSEGEYLWQQFYGGIRKDVLYDVAVVSPEGDLAVVGTTESYGDGNKGFWYFQTDPAGERVWERLLGGSSDDFGHSICMTHDGGLLLSGGTRSFGIGGSDFWVVKSRPDGSFEGEGPFLIPFPSVAAHPVPDKPSGNDTASGPDLLTEAKQPVESLPGGDLFKPNLYVLAVGVSEYHDPSVNLTFAHSDAEAIADRFEEMEGSLFEKVEVKKILNREATLVNIKTGISWLERQATQHDVILMFVSSHGALDHKGNLYILPTDFNAFNLFATALNIRDLTEGVNAVPCKKLLLLDACHSGQSGHDLLAFDEQKSVNTNQIVQELIQAEPGLTVMTSSSGREYSYETTTWGHGAFTKAILEGLDGPADYNEDQVVSLHELNLYVSERVKALTGGRQHPYTPINLFGNIPLFVLGK